MLERLFGNEALRRDLGKALADGTLPPALLLCGAAGLGKNYAARLIAADALYPQGGPGAQAVLEGRSPECLIVSPDGKKNIIPVAAVRTMRSALHATSLSAEGRAAVLEDAGRMEPPAANALLKILEEPPEGVLFVLAADSEAAVLPTIRSRCALYTLAPLTAAECARQLTARGAAAHDAALLAAVYGGAYGLCLAALEPRRRAQLDAALEFVRRSAAGDRFGLMAALAGYESRDDRTAAFDFLFDLQQICAAALEGRTLPGRGAVSRAAAAAALPAVLEAGRRLTAFGSPKLVFSLLALRFADAFAANPTR